MGFPVFPADPQRSSSASCVISNTILNPPWAVGLIETLERDLPASSPGDYIAEIDQAAKEESLAAAILNQGERTDLQSKEFSKILSTISATSSSLAVRLHGVLGAGP